jgi:hypothetical protein
MYILETVKKVYQLTTFYVRESISEDLMSWTILVEEAPCSLKIPSITDISVEVVSRPQKALQSLTTKPAPITSDPLFTVPATKGT